MDPEAQRRARAAVERVVAFYETLSRASLGRLDDVYAGNAHFSDPFNDVRGVAAIRRVFERMYEQVDAPAFRIDDRVVDAGAAMLAWTMTFRFRSRGTTQSIRGVSHLVLDADGRVLDHRDYWDAAGELYAKLPVVGGLMRWLARRVG